MLYIGSCYTFMIDLLKYIQQQYKQIFTIYQLQMLTNSFIYDSIPQYHIFLQVPKMQLINNRNRFYIRQNIQDMTYMKVLIGLFLISIINAAVVVNPITGITAKNLMYTGTIGVDNEKLFFTYYGYDGETNPDNLASKPLTIAVGTPGRSAQYINLNGLGPKNLNQLTLSDNPNRITAFSNALFIDTLGSGFSFASSLAAIPKTMKDHAAILSKAINSFISQTNLGKSKSLYLIGESTFVRAVTGMTDITGLKAVVFLSPWFDFYELGTTYGAAGVDLKIFTNSEKIVIDSTFSTCFTMQRNNKFAEAHNCYDVTVDYIETKTKQRNLYNIKKQSNLTQFLPMTQYYFSQAATVTAYKAPNTGLFESQSNQAYWNLYEDQAKNINDGISKYMKDFQSVKQIFIVNDNDFLVYRKAVRSWLENTLVFTESAKFKPLNLSEYSIDGKVVGYKKAVTQVAYYELLNSGHFSYNDEPAVVSKIISELSGNGNDMIIQEQEEEIQQQFVMLRGRNEHERHQHIKIDDQ